METISQFGYQTNWFLMGTLGIIAVLSSIRLLYLLRIENN